MIKGKSIESPLEMLRESKGISQTELAIRVGCYQNLISKYERSGEIPGKQYIAQMGKALDISVVDLVALYNKNLLEFYGVEDLSNATSLDGTKFPYNMINGIALLLRLKIYLIVASDKKILLCFFIMCASFFGPVEIDV